MNTPKPYLIRAIYEWLNDNNLTPYLLVDTEHHDTTVPRQFIEDGKIVLNIRPQAVDGLTMGNHEIRFNARFGGRPMHIVVPVAAVLAIYANENGQGMAFDPSEYAGDTPPEKKRPSLRVVK